LRAFGFLGLANSGSFAHRQHRICVAWYGALTEPNAPRDQYTAELHLQMIKYADELGNITSKEFCEGVGLKKVSELSLVRCAI